LSEFDFEAVELSVGAGKVPRRVSAFGRERQGFALRRGATDGERRAQESEADSVKKFISVPLFLNALAGGQALNPAAVSDRSDTQ